MFHTFVELHTSHYHDDVIKSKHFPRYWPFVRGIHRSPVNSPHKGQWRGALMFSLICAWINGWVNYGNAGDLRRHRAHYEVIVMTIRNLPCQFKKLVFLWFLLCRKVCANLFEDRAPVDFIYGCPIFEWGCSALPLTHLPVPHICVSKSDQYWFR